MYFVIIVPTFVHPQGSIQVACMRKLGEVEPDVAQQALCQAYPVPCSTAEVSDFCTAGPAITEQPTPIQGTFVHETYGQKRL